MRAFYLFKIALGWENKLPCGNDGCDGFACLGFKFNESESVATLEPTETVTLRHVSLRQVILNGSDNDYRVWSIGWV